MTATSPAVIVGAFEHPGRKLPGYTISRLLREVTHGALADAGLAPSDIDGFFCDSTVPGLGPMQTAGYLGIYPTIADSTDVGGSTYVAAVGRADKAIRAGMCRAALVILGGLPLSASAAGPSGVSSTPGPAAAYDFVGMHPIVSSYAWCAQRHAYEFGTTPEQLAWIKVAASQHAQHNEHAMLREPVTVEDVVSSPLIADPLHRLDSCVVSDGGGALVVVHPDLARELGRDGARVLGHGEALKHVDNGRVDLVTSAAARSGPVAFAEAGVTPADIDYASLYDSFTITVLLQLEDLGFCEKGAGGRFVEDGGLLARGGRLPFNTDGGGLCNNHPANRGGMTKVIEAVRQLRGEAHPAVQVEDCQLALVSAVGGLLASRHHAATLVLEGVRN